MVEFLTWIAWPAWKSGTASPDPFEKKTGSVDVAIRMQHQRISRCTRVIVWARVVRIEDIYRHIDHIQGGMTNFPRRPQA